MNTSCYYSFYIVAGRLLNGETAKVGLGKYLQDASTELSNKYRVPANRVLVSAESQDAAAQQFMLRIKKEFVKVFTNLKIPSNLECTLETAQSGLEHILAIKQDDWPFLDLKYEIKKHSKTPSQNDLLQASQGGSMPEYSDAAVYTVDWYLNNVRWVSKK